MQGDAPNGARGAGCFACFTFFPKLKKQKNRKRWNERLSKKLTNTQRALQETDKPPTQPKTFRQWLRNLFRKDRTAFEDEQVTTTQFHETVDILALSTDDDNREELESSDSKNNLDVALPKAGTDSVAVTSHQSDAQVESASENDNLVEIPRDFDIDLVKDLLKDLVNAVCFSEKFLNSLIEDDIQFYTKASGLVSTWKRQPLVNCDVTMVSQKVTNEEDYVVVVSPHGDSPTNTEPTILPGVMTSRSSRTGLRVRQLSCSDLPEVDI